jgi:membrane protein DedA with SNARE-associated domain
VDDVAAFIVRHGYAILFGWILLDQLGLPVPALPALLAAGALARGGELDLAGVILVSTAACLPGDLLWYEIGRRRGASVLRCLCRVSLEPDSCVRSTEAIFARHGARALVGAKFLPGFQTVAPPLAGLLRMGLPRFLAFDTAGALVWASAFVLAGYALREQLEPAAQLAAQLGGGLAAALAAGIGVYVLGKLTQRRRFLRSIEMSRISPRELERRLAAGEPIEVIDLRHAIDLEADPRMLPGARRLSAEEIEQGAELPRDRDVVLYCRCPNEASSARVALLLRRRGVTRVRPLEGGLDAWIELGLPLNCASA